VPWQPTASVKAWASMRHEQVKALSSQRAWSVQESMASEMKARAAAGISPPPRQMLTSSVMGGASLRDWTSMARTLGRYSSSSGSLSR